MIWGVLAYLMWGFFPAFFPLLRPAEPVEILAHRFVWTLVFVAVILLFTSGFRWMRTIPARLWLRIAAAAVLIAGNWGLYIYAVNSDHVADAALGYFINPLVSVVLGVLVLRERLRMLQWVSVAIAGVAVVILTVALGSPPVVSLGLALSFAGYGLLKKRVPLTPLQSLTAETAVLAPVGVLFLAWLQTQGMNTMLQGGHGVGHVLLLITAGAVTALPLLCFARAAHELSLTSLGMLQYLTPVMQMLWAVFYVGEDIEPARWVGFAVIWVALIVFVTDMLLNSRRTNKMRKLENDGAQ
ncbi:MAG TPA: EamA family transporter RarD [Candidatus Corynebacterium avicola]|uniref:EamA family transporter RarD n=1 Tax=Candidatus Corynebacterium avicola TaxID=2838527 RepID=A0A9D1ULG4_9CORY|nr:EamA family transporter RarD [Candidatus Corynebacterium avicola]